MSCSAQEIGKIIHKYIIERAADKSSKVFTQSSCKSSGSEVGWVDRHSKGFTVFGVRVQDQIEYLSSIQ